MGRKDNNIDSYEQSRVREYDGGERVVGDEDITELWFFRAICKFNDRAWPNGWYKPKSFELTGWRFVILDALSYLVHRLGYTRNSYDQDYWLLMQEAKDGICDTCHTVRKEILFYLLNSGGWEWVEVGGGGEMWGNIPIWDSLRREIAKLSGCSVAEIAIVGVRGIWREGRRDG